MVAAGFFLEDSDPGLSGGSWHDVGDGLRWVDPWGCALALRDEVDGVLGPARVEFWPTLQTVKVRTVYCATVGAERPPCYSKYGPKPILFATVTLSRIKQPTLNLKRSASVDNARRFSTFSLHNWL